MSAGRHRATTQTCRCPDNRRRRPREPEGCLGLAPCGCCSCSALAAPAAPHAAAPRRPPGRRPIRRRRRCRSRASSTRRPYGAKPPLRPVVTAGDRSTRGPDGREQGASPPARRRSATMSGALGRARRDVRLRPRAALLRPARERVLPPARPPPLPRAATSIRRSARSATTRALLRALGLVMRLRVPRARRPTPDSVRVVRAVGRPLPRDRCRSAHALHAQRRRASRPPRDPRRRRANLGARRRDARSRRRRRSARDGHAEVRHRSRLTPTARR